MGRNERILAGFVRAGALALALAGCNSQDAAEPTYATQMAAPLADGAVSNTSGLAGPQAGSVEEAGQLERFPLRLSADKRGLVDALGNPFIMRGEAAWSLVAGPDDAGVVQYLDNRKAKGVNAIIVNLVERYFNGPTDAYGNNPFLTTGDFTTPNEAYFARADAIIQQARERGMLVLLVPAYLGWQGGPQGWYVEVNANGPTKMAQYGRYIGQRYRNVPNIMWVMGGDYGPHNALDEIRAMVQGIQEQAGQSQLFTVHSGQGSSFNDGYSTTIDTWVSVDNLYYYSDCRVHVELMQGMYNRTPPFGFFFSEGHYENHENPTALCLREQEYWPPLLGANGYFFGVTPVWNFDPGWQNTLESPGSLDLKRANFLFASRPYHFTPNSVHGALTAGALSGGNAAAAGRSPNGETVIVYTPTQRALTIDMTKVGGANAQGWWYKPTTGVVTDLGTFATTGSRSFTPPATGDWVLVLDNAALGLPPPGTLDEQAPSAPGAPVGSGATSTSVNLSWAAATDNFGVALYRILRDGVVVGSSATASYTDTGIPNGGLHQYAVLAVDATGNQGASSPSSSIAILQSLDEARDAADARRN